MSPPRKDKLRDALDANSLRDVMLNLGGSALLRRVKRRRLAAARAEKAKGKEKET
jgi:hypothetical protein